MSAPPSLSDNSRYEQACDQAIAMCDGNLRSTIKALIMANEYLETELEELQAAIAAGCVPAHPHACEQQRRLNSETGATTMADVTYYVALPFLQDDDRLAGRGRRRGMPELDHRAAARRDAVADAPAASARSPSAAPAIP